MYFHHYDYHTINAYFLTLHDIVLTHHDPLYHPYSTFTTLKRGVYHSGALHGLGSRMNQAHARL